MKEKITLPCDIVRDLLPLYHDGVASETTQDAVRGHIEACDACRDEYEKLCEELPMENRSSSPKKKFLGMVKNQKRLKKLMIAVISLACCVILIGGYLLQLQFPVIPMPDELITVHRAYRYENEDGYNYFLMMELPYGWTHANFYEGKNGDTSFLTFIAKKPLISPGWSDKTRHRIFNFTSESTDIDVVFAGGKAVWMEGATDTPVPEFVYIYNDYEHGRNNVYGGTYDFDEGYIGFYFEDGTYKEWNLDGTLLKEEKNE